nr:serine/threonine-protein kinase TEL1 [Cryptococcus tetragattii IND107]
MFSRVYGRIFYRPSCMIRRRTRQSPRRAIEFQCRPSKLPSFLSPFHPHPHRRTSNHASPASASASLVHAIWKLPDVSAALQGLFPVCLQVITRSSSTSQPAHPSYANDENNGENNDDGDGDGDDDFAITSGETTSAAPLLPDQVADWKASTSLLRSAVAFRLQGVMLANGASRAYKDTPLINAFLQADGVRAVEIGCAICKAIRKGWLRLGADAVEAVVAALGDMLDSYGYARDERLLQLCLEFLTCSAPIWMKNSTSSTSGGDSGDDDLMDEAMRLVCYIATKITAGSITSWKVRLAMLCFIEAFLHYDSAPKLWSECMVQEEVADDDRDDDDDVGMEDENHLFHYISQALCDPDMRVRTRAASTAASALYRPSIHPAEHSIIYDHASRLQAADPTFAEHYLSYVLWKLNCCIASAKQRQRVIFDLYETAISGTEYSDHLQAGLDAVARRLGLSSITALYLPYAPTTTISHDTSRSSAITFVLSTTHRLFGSSSSRSAFFTACLEHAGAYMLYCGKIGLFTSACEAAGVLPKDLALQHSVAAAAMAMVLFYSNDKTKTNSLRMNKCKAEAVALLSTFPGMSGDHPAAEELLHNYANGVAAHLWELMDLESSVDEIVAWLDMMEKDTAAGNAFAQMMANDDNAKTGKVKAINPAASFQSIYNVCKFLEKDYSSISVHAFTFAAILRLTSLINNAFLVSEQRRYLRALAMLLSVYQGTLQRPLIWEAFLTETITLLLQPDICRTVLSMVIWAFDRLESLSSTPSKLVNIFCQLGEIRIELGGSGISSSSQPNQIGDAVEEWIVKMSPKWSKSQISQEAFERAVALWPDSLKNRLSVLAIPLSLRDLADLSQNEAVHNAGQLCKQFLHLADAEHRQDVASVFVDSTFWSLKDKISRLWDKGGINAFQDLLYLCNGEVRAPSLDFYGQDTSGKALTATSGQHRKMEAMNALHLAICKTMVQPLHDRRPQIRSAAYCCLQRMKPILTGKDLKALPPDISDVVPILVPIPVGSTSQSQAIQLDGIINSAAWSKKAENFATWSHELSRLLCKVASQHDKFFLSFEPLLSTPLFPLHRFLGHFVHASLVCSRSMNFERSKAISEHFEMVLKNPFASTEAVQSIVNIVLELRKYEHPFKSGMLGYNAWLSVNFVDLSKAAAKCGLYVSALLFLELANDQEGSLDLGEHSVRQIMYDIYSNVEDPDGFYGVHNKDIRDSLRRRLEHEGLSWQALGWAGAVYNVDGNDRKSAIPVLHHLHDIGLSRLASVVANETRTCGSGPLDDPFFADLSWRTGDWNLPIDKKSGSTSSGLLYSALRAVHRSKSSDSASMIVDKASRAEMTRLSGLQKEMLTSIKSTVTNLLCLRELDHWLDPQLQQDIHEAIDKGTVVNLQDINDRFEFASVERIIATRLSVFDSVKQRESQDMIGDALTPKMEMVTKAESMCHIKLSRLALKSNNLQAAINSLTALQKLQDDVGEIDEAQDVFCEVLWKQGEHTLAIQYVEDLLLREKEKKSKGQRIPFLQGRLAHWASEARLKAANEIFGMFSDVAKSIKRSTSDISEHAEIFYQFACFADKQYVNQSSSADVKQLKEYSKLRSSQASRVTARQSRARESDHKDIASREAERDEQKLKKFEIQQKQYLNAALRFYAEAVSMTDNFNDCITRLVTLWLENDKNDESNTTFSRSIQKVPSYKFIFLGPQLAARLHRPETPTIFNSTLNGLMLRMSQDHPYHTLYHVIPLLWEHKQPQSINSSTLGRKSAADDIMMRLTSSSSNQLASGAAKSMKRFVAIAMEWTSFIEKDKRLEYKIPSDSPLRKAPRDIPVATSTPPVDITCQYNDIATFDHFSEWYTRAGGLSRPKVMKCFDSKGQIYTQLFKKDDGFRQDAVMEQIFVLVNDLLNRNRETRSRKLRYRTYGVLALPDATGVIEFVVGTKPLIKYLPPAHEKYHPKDITSHDFLKAMQEVQSVKNNDEKIIQVWTKLKKRFRPVMRQLFTEKYRDPMAWFSMRLTYARSLAVTSIVGWVLEIGDRHCSNILMDECTGELVHIDFGIAFGAGRILPIPELVPFRLTDDLVDALGVTGVNGTFRQCSQLVLQTLIDSSDVVLTILEVFKQDPLHTWMVDDKMKKAQDGNHKMYPERGQEKADRIMRETRENLSKELSVQYRVNQLIQEARDVNNLATIFRGWHSWL